MLQIELSQDQIDKIIQEGLTKAYLDLVVELEAREVGIHTQPPLFSYDEEVERKKVLKLVKGFERVLRHYGG